MGKTNGHRLIARTRGDLHHPDAIAESEPPSQGSVNRRGKQKVAGFSILYFDTIVDSVQRHIGNPGLVFGANGYLVGARLQKGASVDRADDRNDRRLLRRHWPVGGRANRDQAIV